MLRQFVRRAFSSNAPTPLVTLERPSAAVAVVKFNSPKTLNALTEATGAEFAEKIDLLCQEAEANPRGLRAVIVTGEGRAFSAGGDVSFLRKRMESSTPDNLETMRKFYARFLSIRRLPVPIIAAINGPAVGAGLCLALACDIRLCSESAKMGLNFVRLGINPGMAGSHFLPLVVGQQNAARLMLTGEIVSSDKALALGIVSQVSRDGECLTDAVALGESIAKGSPTAVRATTQALRLRSAKGLEDALAAEAKGQSDCYKGTDLDEGLNAVKEKRAPNFDN